MNEHGEVLPNEKPLEEALDRVIHELQPTVKSADNPYFNSKYADLNQVLNEVKKVCLKHKLRIYQHPMYKTSEADGVPIRVAIGVMTVLSHPETSYSLEVPCLLPVDKLTPQQGGSAITYARRYALNCLFMLESVDDDGNYASKPPKAEAKSDNGKIIAAYKQSMFDAKTGPELEAVYINTKNDSLLKPEEKKALYEYTIERNKKLKGE